MEIVRKYEDVEIRFKITDDEIVQAISKMKPDERLVFLRKLFQTDIGKMFPFNIKL